MKKLFIMLAVAGFLVGMAGSGWAHFGMVIADDPIATQDKREVKLTLSFSHPFEAVGMELVKPKKFDVYFDGTAQSLLGDLKSVQIMGHASWQASFTPKRPGVYQFVMEPTPYWEPAEDVSIIHYTKTVVCAFGDEDGWDRELGLKTEIVPLSRPFGAWAGYSFSGQVKLDGKPVPWAEVEVEYYNHDQKYVPASDIHITYVLKADQNGVFTFACPQPGWWGFAALNEADYTLKNPKGQEKGVELGAVLWIEVAPWQTK